MINALENRIGSDEIFRSKNMEGNQQDEIEWGIIYLTSIYFTLSYGQVLCWPGDTSGKPENIATATDLIQLDEHI